MAFGPVAAPERTARVLPLLARVARMWDRAASAASHAHLPPLAARSAPWPAARALLRRPPRSHTPNVPAPILSPLATRRERAEASPSPSPGYVRPCSRRQSARAV